MKANAEEASHTYLTETSSKDDNLVYFTHFLQEVIDPWTLNYVHIVPVILDFHRHNIVSLLY